jgi:short-subunit dehydrogenase
MARSFANVRCLVTGASSGLGREFAQTLASRGAQVIATGRSAERLAIVESSAQGQDGAPRIETVIADLTSERDRAGLFARVGERFGGALDLVVQSAGVGGYGRFMSHDPGLLRALVEVNLFALAEVARGIYPMLLRGTRPAMVVMGSVVARRGLPGRSEYSASKHAVAGLVEGRRAEWTLDGIHILLVNPGFTRTEFEDHLLVDTTYKSMKHKRRMSAEQVTEATLRALARRKNEITLSLDGRLLLAFNRLMPRFVDWGLGRWTRKLYASHRVHEEADA